MSKDPDRSKRIWDTVLTVGLIVLVFLWFNSCAKEEAKKLEIVEQAERDAIIEDLEEKGYIPEYMDRSDGVYIKIPHYIIDIATQVMECYDSELTPEEYYDYLDGMWSVAHFIYENIPVGY